MPTPTTSDAAYYMLNLIFDTTDTAYGRFMEYAANDNVLLSSKAWLQPSATAPAPPAVPDYNDSTQWVLNARDHLHLSFNVNQTPPATIVVRIIDSNPANNNFARITILMGRNDQKQAQQAMSSPFYSGGVVTAGPVSIWDQASVRASATAGSNSGVVSWIQKLGVANEGTVNMVNKYIFLAAATVAQGSALYTFTHDPDMDIAC